MKRLFTLAIGVAFLVSVCALSAAQERQIIVSGYLEDTTVSPPMPLDGTYDWSISFFQYPKHWDIVEGIVHPPIAGPTTGTVEVRTGFFSITLTPPPIILEMPNAYFDLSIDTDRDGMDADDQFGDRFWVSSVLYSVGGVPAPSFVAHSGHTADYYSLQTSTTLRLAPFVSPSAGVRYNRMTILIVKSGDVVRDICFGIYDRNGNRVSTSGKIALPPGTKNELWEVTVPEASLEPSSIYYTGWTSEGALPFIGCGPLPILPGYGVILNATPTGEIPEHFDPQSVLRTQKNEPVLAVSLTYVEEE